MKWLKCREDLIEAWITFFKYCRKYGTPVFSAVFITLWNILRCSWMKGVIYFSKKLHRKWVSVFEVSAFYGAFNLHYSLVIWLNSHLKSCSYRHSLYLSDIVWKYVDYWLVIHDPIIHEWLQWHPWIPFKLLSCCLFFFFALFCVWFHNSTIKNDNSYKGVGCFNADNEIMK